MNVLSTVLIIALTTSGAAIFLRFVSGYAWFQYPLSAIIAYAISMLLILIARHLVPLSLPNWYFRIRSFEDGGRLYLRFGIKVFKKLLLILGFDALNWLVRFSGRRAGLQDLFQGVRQAETDHTVSFVVLMFVIIYALMMRWLEVTAWLALVNIIANIYPVMLQRYNRARIEILLDISR